MSKREQIAAGLVKALSGVSGVGQNVFRSRIDAISSEEVPALVVLFETEEVAENVHGDVDARLDFLVETHARATAAADKSADAVVSSVHAKLMTEPSLGGLLFDLSEVGTEWDYDDSDTAAVVVRSRFSAHYRRPRATLG